MKRLMQLKKTLPSVFALLALVTFAACGNDKIHGGGNSSTTVTEQPVNPDTTTPPSGDPDQPAPPPPPVMECDVESQICGAGRYCLQSVKDAKVIEARCMPLPADCGDCDCAKQDSSAHFDRALNCAGSNTQCSFRDAANISVSCGR